MITIWKYLIPNTTEFTIILPLGAEILKLDTQRGQPCIWVELDTKQFGIERKFYIVCTGDEIPEDKYNRSIYVGTFQMEYGTLILHLFEEIKE